MCLVSRDKPSMISFRTIWGVQKKTLFSFQKRCRALLEQVDPVNKIVSFSLNPTYLWQAETYTIQFTASRGSRKKKPKQTNSKQSYENIILVAQQEVWNEP